MGKKLKGGRRQILQLEEKKPPKVPSKSTVKSLIHYSDSDDDSKKSNESESSPSAAAQNKDATPLESQIADFFKEIDALSVPDELLEEPDKATSSSKAETVNENTTEAHSSDTAVDLPSSASKDDKHSDTPNKEAYCPWQEICDSSTGYSYYWNVHTNEVTWDCPPEYAAYIQSFNASTEKTKHAAQNDKNTDGKEKKKKKRDIVVPEGAIIPISYFGNSSSEDDSSDSESEFSNKKPKSEKVIELKKNKITKKMDSRSKTNEGETSEVFGPSLPPDFQFPVNESIADDTDSSPITSGQNEVSESVKVVSSVPPETFSDAIEKPSQSDLDEFPAESSTHENSWENSLKDAEKRYAEMNEKAGDASPDSTEKKGENPLVRNAHQFGNSTYGLRSVVEYDSFSDDDEEICVANISSSKPNSSDEKNYEIKSCIQQEQENKTESSTSVKTLFDAESKISSFKRKVSEVLKEDTKKEELIKKPKRSDVNIDSLFASHSSYGKYGFGFGWQKQLDEQNEELCTTSNQDYKTHKHQNEFKAVSFVKSEDILDLKALNEEIVCDDAKHTLPDESVQTSAECDQSNALEKNEKPLAHKEEIVENSEANEDKEISNDYDVGSSSMISIKDKIDCSILNRKKKNGKFHFNAGSTSLKVEDDLDEIDKALCEALDAKKSAKNLPLRSSSPVTDVTNTPINVLESTATISEEKLKEAESGDENPIDTDAMTDDILEISSELIDKLTFLLSAPSTHASFSGVFFQLQTRFVDWQAGALNSTYFMARLKELEQYIQHYETGVISGEWTYQWDSQLNTKIGMTFGRRDSTHWDSMVHSISGVMKHDVPYGKIDVLHVKYRENKRYFFINTRTRHSQWTYPEELCNQEKSSWVQSQAEAGPSSASSFVTERDDLQTVSSSSTTHENSAPKHSTSSFALESKENSPGARWILQSSPPPPPPGVDSPPPPPHTPPPKSPPPPPPDSTETLREPEDMDLENSNDSSSFLFVNNKTMADDGRMQFISMGEQSSKRSPINFANASIFNAVSSTSMSGCEDLSTVSKLSNSTSHSLETSEVNSVHWSRPSCSSQVKINSISTGSALSIDVPVNLIEEKNSDIHASSTNGVCSSQSDTLHLKLARPGNTVSKKEKKKTKIQPGLGLKKKNIPSLVEKWQKIKEQQEREDNDPDDC